MQVKVLFLDIGGVLLTNGWDHHARRRAAERFGLNYEEMNERHHLTYDTYEEGKLGLNEYLHRVIFHQHRSFSNKEFQDFIFAQSKPFSEMMSYIKDLKARYRFRVCAISNEGRELMIYRIREFNLDSFIDFFISSCFVHYRKPDEDIYRIALDIANVKPDHSIYIEDRPMFVDVANDLGIHGIVHVDMERTKAELAALGMSV